MTTAITSTHPSLQAYFPSGAGTSILSRIRTALAAGYCHSADNSVKAYTPGWYDASGNLTVWVTRDAGHWAYPALAYFESDTAFLKGPLDALVGLGRPRAPESFNGALAYAEHTPMDESGYNPMDCATDQGYTAISAAYQAWRATGDDAWIATVLPTLNTWWAYAFSDANHYDAGTGLPKRIHTPETWDYDFKIRQNFVNIPVAERFWTVLTSDIAGFYAAAGQMAEMYAATGNTADADRYAGYQDAIKTAADACLWDDVRGRFKIHHDITLAEGQTNVGGTSITYTGTGALYPFWPHTDVDRLSLLGNATAIDAGLASAAQRDAAVSTLVAWITANVGAGKKYAGGMVPLYDPEYPSGVLQQSSAYRFNVGDYNNGRPAAFVTATLAKALLDSSEATGWTLLKAAMDSLIALGSWSFFYNYDGTFASQPTDPTLRANPWCAGQTVKAIIEGLAGIVPGPGMETVTISPRWGQIGISPNGQTYTARAEFPAAGFWVSYVLTWSADGTSVTGSIDGTHATGILEIPGMVAIPLTGGPQEISTGTTSAVFPALSASVGSRRCVKGSVTGLGGVVRTNDTRFDLSLDGEAFTPTVEVEAGTTDVWLGCTPQEGDSGTLTAKVGVEKARVAL